MIKKILFIGLLFIAGSAFSQHIKNVPLNSEQEKKVKTLHKDVNSQLKAVIENNKMTADEKKNKVYEIKAQRNEQLHKELLPEQIGTILEKDPIKWDNALKQIDKTETAKLKAERDGKLKELDKQITDLEKQNDGLQKQIDDLKQKQKELGNQVNGIKQQKKEVNAQYK